MRFLHSSAAILCLLLIVFVFGCGRTGPKLYEVTGTVSYRGKPLPLGTVMFVPQKGPASEPALIGKDGSYRLKVVPGTHRVQVTARPVFPNAGQKPSKGAGLDAMVQLPKQNASSLIPEKYSRLDTTDVSVEVEAKPDNVVDIELR